MDIDAREYQKQLNWFFAGAKSYFNEAEKKYEQKLKGFFEPLIFKYRVAKEIKVQTDRYLATDFNFIDILSPDENKVSDLIALLLEPNGVHGQGSKFLELFLERLEIAGVAFPLEGKKIEIVREASTEEERRIDILIEITDDKEKFCIGIENKLFAQEQPDQLGDYNQYLADISDNYLLVYLDALAREPETIDPKVREELEKLNKFKTLDYANFLRNWLEACYKECEAEKIRWFIKDFIVWIDKYYREARYEYE